MSHNEERSARKCSDASSSSLNSQEIINVLNSRTDTSRKLYNLCRGDPLTNAGRRFQLLKILTLTLLPILGLWAFTVHSLLDSVQGKADMEKTRTAVEVSVEIGKVLESIQRERDMSVLYLSIIGPQTKSFLMNEYLLTDQSLEELSTWPLKTNISSMFHSKEIFQKFLKEHRKLLDPKNFDIYVEMAFYNSLIEPFVEWLYDAITESNVAPMWKLLVSYQKIVTGMEQIGIERALGAVFYLSGGFPTKSVSESYNNKVHVFRSTYRSAVLFSDQIDPIFQKGISRSGTNLTTVLEKFRFEIQHSIEIMPTMEKAQWWFDNMTQFLDILLDIQEELATLISDQLNTAIEGEERKLWVNVLFLVVVFVMCPLIIYSVKALTSDTQLYALTLVMKTKELSKEKKKTDNLLYQMVPKRIADLLKINNNVDAEYFKSVTIMFSDIVGFTQISIDCTPFEIVRLLNCIYTSFDERLSDYDVYKVETINDTYMVASGLPNRIGNRHAMEIANLAIDLIEMDIRRRFSTPDDQRIRLRIGINSGPCIAGIVGTIMPRYCLFGDTVNTASRMKSCGLAGKIHLSWNAYKAIGKHGVFCMSHREAIRVKGKGMMQTYWLDGVKLEPPNRDTSFPETSELHI